MNTELTELYQTFGPMVWRRCQKLLKNETLAHDAMQDVFVQVIRNKNVLDFTNPSSLLYRIATNVCLNKIRSDIRRFDVCVDDQQHELLLKIAAIEDVESEFIFSNLLGFVFKQVPESSRTIAVLHYVDGLTLSQVATEVDMSVSGVRKRLSQLRVQLKEIEGSKL